MAIALVTGPPGSGKTYYAMRRIAEALRQGKPVVTNIALKPGWQQYLKHRDPGLLLHPRKRKTWKRVDDFYFYSEDLESLLLTRVNGHKEDRGLVVLDEAHNWLNSRSWTTEDRAEIVRWFTQHRKHGWEVLLLSQQAAMLDKQVRDLFEYQIRLRNLKKAKIFGVSPIPCNLFLALWNWHSGARVVVKREVYPLTKLRKFYTTMQLSHGEQERDDLLWLPASAEERAEWEARRGTPEGAPLGQGKLPTTRPSGHVDLFRRDPTGTAIDDDDVSDVQAQIDPTGQELSGAEGDPESLDPTGDGEYTPEIRDPTLSELKYHRKHNDWPESYEQAKRDALDLAPRD